MYNLNRFVDAQDGPMGYETAIEEIRKGRKQSHWIWYIFPQIKGLGQSYDSRYYGIDSLYEARQYMEYEQLGSRLREITCEVLKHQIDGIEYIMGGSDIDVIKFRSSMTLFDVVCPGERFKEALDTFFNGERDEKTLAIIQSEREYLYSDSAFLRHHIPYMDKGFFETGSYESHEIPDGKRLPTLVDLFLKGEQIKDMLHHYLYHRDFSAYRVSGVESTLEYYCRSLLIDLYKLGDEKQRHMMVQNFKGWEDRISDVETAAETLDWILGTTTDSAPTLLEEYAKMSVIKEQ